jgi:hypothetical protein
LLDFDRPLLLSRRYAKHFNPLDIPKKGDHLVQTFGDLDSMRDSYFDSLSPQERLTEIAEILAAGLMRVRLRQSSPLSGDPGESSLHISPGQSGHLTSENRRMSDG